VERHRARIHVEATLELNDDGDDRHHGYEHDHNDLTVRRHTVFPFTRQTGRLPEPCRDDKPEHRDGPHGHCSTTGPNASRLTVRRVIGRAVCTLEPDLFVVDGLNSGHILTLAPLVNLATHWFRSRLSAPFVNSG
jgi:hypothetical protein